MFNCFYDKFSSFLDWNNFIELFINKYFIWMKIQSQFSNAYIISNYFKFIFLCYQINSTINASKCNYWYRKSTMNNIIRYAYVGNLNEKIFIKMFRLHIMIPSTARFLTTISIMTTIHHSVRCSYHRVFYR